MWSFYYESRFDTSVPRGVSAHVVMLESRMLLTTPGLIFKKKKKSKLFKKIYLF